MRIPRDPALPALQDVFPKRGAPEFVASAVHEMTGRDVDAARAQIRFVRYRPGKSCIILWVFDAGEAPLMVSGKLFRHERGAGVTLRPSFQRQAAEAQRRLGGFETYRYLPEQQLLLQLYPMDTRMPALTLAEDESWLRDALAPALGTRAIRLVSAAPVSYKPWRRCVYEYHLEVDGSPRRFFGKLFVDDQGERLLRSQGALERYLREAAAPWKIVAPVAHIAEARMLVLEAINGGVEMRHLIENPSRNGDLGPALERIAYGLTVFQRAELPGLLELAPLGIVRHFRDGAKGLEVVAQEFATPVDRLFQALEDQARKLRPEPLVPTHGAFRYDQFLLSEGEMAAIDLDTLCLSGASADAGNFLGYLDVIGVRRPALKEAVETCAPLFEEAVLRLPGVSPDWLRWYRAVAHVRKALRAFYSLDAKWPRIVGDLLPRAERTLASRAMP